MRRFLTAAITALALVGALPSGPASAQSDAGARTERLRITEIAAMPPGSWLSYGAAWASLGLGRDDSCVDPDGIIGAWNGGLWDGRYFWLWGGGGHGDGCFNGILRYDIEAGAPEVAVPHLPLNVPLLRVYRYDEDGNPSDGWNEPYVSETPWPACNGQGVNCEGLSKQHRMENGPWIDQGDQDSTDFGAYLRPRSSHMYNNMVRIGDWVYMPVGGIWGSAKSDNQVWRFNVTDPANTIERLPNQTVGGPTMNWIIRPGEAPVLHVGSNYCATDMVAGSYDCARGPYTGNGTVAWDESRDGFWVIDSQRERLLFVREGGDGWVVADEVRDPMLTKRATLGNPGLCIVPTDQGTQPVIWGENGHLIRYDGTALHVIEGQAGQPAQGASSVLNKWTWREDLGVCLGSWNWDEGLWAWKPDFAAWDAPAPEPDPTPDPDPDPEPDPTPDPDPEPKPEPDLDSEPEPKASLPDVEFSTFAGHLAAPLPVVLAAWDQPAALEPEAPDVAALCPGAWVERTYATAEEIAGAEAQNRGLANVRVYLRPGVYEARLKFDKVKCAEVIGIPNADGDKPVIRGENIVSPEVGIIVRGVVLDAGHVTYSGNHTLGRYQKYLILHGVRVIENGPLLGNARPEASPTYIEFKGTVFGPNAGWHLLYFERSTGPLVAVGSVFFGPGRGYHSFKNLAHYSRLEGNLFSNAGVDGQPTGFDNRGDPLVGLFSLDLYACNDVVFRENTVIHRADTFVKAYLGSRSRNAWGGCNRGRRLSDGTREVFQPGSPEYNDHAVWDEIGEAVDRAGTDYAAWAAEDWLTTYLVEDNTFVLIRRAPDDKAALISFESQRPLMTNDQEAAAKPRYKALTALCAEEATYKDQEACWVANADAELLYVFNHIEPTRRPLLVNQGKPPNSQPVEVPPNWRERAAHFVGENLQIVCDAKGLSCAALPGPWTFRGAQGQPWDDVQVANPPRLFER